MTILTWKKKSVVAALVCAILVVSAFTLLMMNKTSEAALIEPYHEGLVGWWRFDEGEGNIAKDSSGNGNDGTIYGATWIDGKYDKALNFDGVNDYASVPDSASCDVGSEITMAAWLYPHNPTAGYIMFIKKQTPGFGFWLFPAGHLYAEVYHPNYQQEGYIPVYGSTELQPNNWYHCVAVYKQNEYFRIYVNGVLDASVTAPNKAIGVNNNPLLLAVPGWMGSGNAFYDGLMDDVRIYNRALSGTEINELFQKMPNFSSKLLAKIPKGTTQVIVTAAWQGIGSLNATIIRSPTEIYTEDMLPVYQKTRYSTSGGTSEMLNIKRLSIVVSALSSDENWNITLAFDNVEEYTITVEVQK